MSNKGDLKDFIDTIDKKVRIVIAENQNTETNDKRTECKICNKWMAKTSYTRHCLSVSHIKNVETM